MIQFKRHLQLLVLLFCVQPIIFSSSFAQTWNLSGNAVSSADKLGSTNPRPLKIITDNTERLRVDPAGDVVLRPETAIRNGGGFAGLQFETLGSNDVPQLSTNLNSLTTGQQLILVPTAQAGLLTPLAPEGLIQLVDASPDGSLMLATGNATTAPRGVYINGDFNSGGNRQVIHLMNGGGDQVYINGETGKSLWRTNLGIDVNGLIDYTSNFHGSYTARTLVDKEYVDDQIGAIPNDNDWIVSGSNLISANTGLVGIGTNSPEGKLEVNLPSNLGDNAGILIDAPFAFAAGGTFPAPKHYFQIRKAGLSGGSTFTKFTVRTNGNVGIDMENPSVRLNISGNALSDKDLLLFSTTHSNGYEWGYSRHGIDDDRGYWAYNAKLEHEDWFVDVGSNNGNATRILQGGGGMFFQYINERWKESHEHNWQGVLQNPWTDAMHINDNNGKIGMGTSNFVGDFRLYVAGGILAERVKVELQGNWPDFVFAEEHPLEELEAVEAFIETNHHLPGIPSAAKVAEDGIDLGQMDAALLQKIEELTLYVIQLKKDNEALQVEVEALKNK